MAQPTTPQQLELDLQAARSHGRWLSDDERTEIEQQERARLLLEEQRQGRRHRLMILAGVCLLIPPLWPLALGLTLYLLFPKTLARVGMVAVLLVVGLGIATAGLMTVFVMWLLTLLS